MQGVLYIRRYEMEHIYAWKQHSYSVLRNENTGTEKFYEAITSDKLKDNIVFITLKSQIVCTFICKVIFLL